MKKLTAGIFSVLMGLVSVNAAEAAVASKDYVDAKIGDTEGKTVVEMISSVSSGSTEATTALAERVTTAESEITTLKGDENVAGSVAKKIADAIGGLSADSVGAEGSFISTVSQADGTITAGATPFVAEITDATKTSTIAPQTAAVATYIDGKITQIDNGLTEQLAPITQGVTDLGGRVDVLEADNTTNKADITAIKAEQVTQNSDIGTLKETVAKLDGSGEGSVAAQIANVTQQVAQVETDYKAADTALDTKLTKAISDGDADTLAAAQAADTEQTTAITTAYQAADTALKTELQGYADQAETDAITTAGANADTKISNLNLAALSRVPVDCQDPDSFCVLTAKGGQFYWEAIERATGEEQPAGTAIPAVKQ